MKGRIKAIVLMGGLLGLLVFTLCGVAMAANPENVTVTAPVAQTLRLSVSKNLVNFGGGNLDPVIGSYNDSLTATVSANVGWTLQVSKDQDLTGLTPGNVIPSAQLTVDSSSADPRVTQTQPGSQFGGVGSPTMIARGNKGGNENVSVNYNLSITWDDNPDTYGATHTYTVVSP
jgi:hypothetical protein